MLNRHLCIAACMMLNQSLHAQDTLTVASESHTIQATTRTGAEVFARLRQGFSNPQCGAAAEPSLGQKSNAINPVRLTKHLKQMLPLLDYVSAETARQHLPAEFALIPILESGYNPAAASKNGPVGLWQMMPKTAKHHGVMINNHYDGRYSPIDSTQAALKYLNHLQHGFADWQTAVMAYNAGEYRIRKKLAQQKLNQSNAQKKLPHGLPTSAYSYIGKLQALVCLIWSADQTLHSGPETTEFIALAPIIIGQDFASLEALQHTTGIPMEQLIRLNPSYRQGIPSASPKALLVPLNVLP